MSHSTDRKESRPKVEVRAQRSGGHGKIRRQTLEPEGSPTRSRRIVRIVPWIAVALSAALIGGGLALGPPSTRGAFVRRPDPQSVSFGRTGGGAIHGAVTGRADGPLVLFVHGTPGAWEDFSFVMAAPALAERARLIAIDRLGWGGSRRNRVEPSLAEQASALAGVLRDAADRRGAIVVGHSLGAAVAARLAMDKPELVRALVLVAGSIDPQLEVETWYQALGRLPFIRPFVPDALVRADDEIRPLRGELEAMLPRWNDLRMPVTVIQGEADALVSPANADFAERMIRNAPLVVERIPGQGHLIPWERPERVVTAVLDYLDAGALVND